MNPHQCPNCRGWGKRETVSAITTIAPQWVTCPNCNGTRLVWVADAQPQMLEALTSVIWRGNA